MNFKNDKWRILLSLFSGTSIGLVITYPHIFTASAIMYASIISSSVFAYGVYAAVNSARHDLRATHLRAEALYAFDSVFGENASNLPTLCKLAEISRFSSSAALKLAVDEIRKRTRFGMRLPEAVVSCSISAPGEAVRGLLHGSNIEEGASIRGVLDSRHMDLAEKMSRAEGMLQRNATLGMFVSTVLPSFAIFGFIGNAILGQTAGSMIMFSMAMLLLLPSMSLALNIVINRVLHA
jgi:hypothetical protein